MLPCLHFWNWRPSQWYFFPEQQHAFQLLPKHGHSSVLYIHSQRWPHPLGLAVQSPQVDHWAWEIGPTKKQLFSVHLSIADLTASSNLFNVSSIISSVCASQMNQGSRASSSIQTPRSYILLMMVSYISPS